MANGKCPVSISAKIVPRGIADSAESKKKNGGLARLHHFKISQNLKNPTLRLRQDPMGPKNRGIGRALVSVIFRDLDLSISRLVIGSFVSTNPMHTYGSQQGSFHAVMLSHVNVQF